MASGTVEAAAPLKTGAVTGISSSSTQSVADLGIITETKGMYVLFLQTDNALNQSTGSCYMVYRLSVAYAVTPIAEGSAADAPRIDSSGVLKLKTTTTGKTIKYATLKIA